MIFEIKLINQKFLTYGTPTICILGLLSLSSAKPPAHNSILDFFFIALINMLTD